MDTQHRAISVASVAFANNGVAATSLDEIARQLGVTKQTILYHFGSKQQLVSAVFADAARVLSDELLRAAETSKPGWPRITSIVRASFALALQRPELIGILREVSRLGAPWSREAIETFQPLVDRAVEHLEAGMAAGRYRKSDSRLLLFSVYASVTAVVSDSEAVRALGLRLDSRVAARLRATVLALLEDTLAPETVTK